MMTLVFFLEEPSAEAMLDSFLPNILPDGWVPQYVVFEGKSDLEKKIMRRLKHWQKPDCRFIVLRDQDSADCKEVKENLRKKCIEGNHPDTIVRIACRELESWYLGDLEAVESGLKISGLKRHQRRAKFRDPDIIMNPARELMRLTKNQYMKISGSRDIGKHLSPDRNTSHSYGIFIQGLKKTLDLSN